MATALDVANYFLAVAPEEDMMTNLKLQKLCAYAQGVNLAYHKRPLFNEEIEAWTHGPVIPEVYAKFSKHGAQPIPSECSEENALAQFSDDESYILQLVWATYGRFTAWALRDQSHWDFPGYFGTKKIMPKKDIQDAFMNNKLVKRIKKNDTLIESSHELEV